MAGKRRLIWILLVVSFLLVMQLPVLAADNGYKLGPGDIIDFSVWNSPELSAKLNVGFDGYVSVPLVGQVKVEGLTLPELDQQLETLLTKFIRSPQVSLSVVQYRMNRVTVLGAVTKSGVYEVPPTAKLLEVLAMAGINETNARLDDVSLTRNGTVMKINVDKLLREGGHQNYVVLADDVIFVPQAIRQVFILGQVVKPGAYNIDDKTTPADVLAMAGGPTERADLKHVKIIHRANKTETEMVDLKNYLEKQPAGTLPYLQVNDVIQVQETKSINWEKIFAYAAGIKVIHDLIVNW